VILDLWLLFGHKSKINPGEGEGEPLDAIDWLQ